MAITIEQIAVCFFLLGTEYCVANEVETQKRPARLDFGEIKDVG